MLENGPDSLDAESLTKGLWSDCGWTVHFLGGHSFSSVLAEDFAEETRARMVVLAAGSTVHLPANPVPPSSSWAG